MAPVRDTCPECRSEDIITDFSAGDIICRGCGVILGDRIIDETAEWRTFACDDRNRQDPNRCGAPLSSTGEMNHTVLRGGGKRQLDALNAVSAKADSNHSQSKTGKAMSASFVKIGEIATALRIPSTVADAGCIILRQLAEKGEYKRKTGTAGDAMCAAVLYLACRQHNASRTILEITPAANITKKEFVKAFKHIEKNLEIDRGVVRGEHLVPRCCDGLAGVPSSLAQTAKHIAAQCSEHDLVGGMNPQMVAGAAVWLGIVCSSLSGYTTQVVAQAAVTTVSALTRAYNQILPYRHQIVPDHVLQKMKTNNVSIDALEPL